MNNFVFYGKKSYGTLQNRDYDFTHIQYSLEICTIFKHF